MNWILGKYDDIIIEEIIEEEEEEDKDRDNKDREEFNTSIEVTTSKATPVATVAHTLLQEIRSINLEVKTYCCTGLVFIKYWKCLSMGICTTALLRV